MITERFRVLFHKSKVMTRRLESKVDTGKNTLISEKENKTRYDKTSEKYSVRELDGI